MKKIYSKPEIMFDSFTLTTNIAAGCGHTTGLHSRDICAVDFGPLKIFSSQAGNVCDTFIEDDDQYCYHATTEDQALFNS